jgi:hypothetical protein
MAGMPFLAVPTALLAHADQTHAAASNSDVASLVLAALPFLCGAALLSRFRNRAGAVVLFSAAAGFVHAAVTPEHFGEDYAVGLFTLAVTIGQMAVVVVGLNRPSRALWASAAAGNTFVLAIWALSRTTGLPVGPGPGVPEAVGLLDLACAAYEIAIVAGSLSLALATTKGMAGRLCRPPASVSHSGALANL